MPISNYATLKAEVINFSGRDDLSESMDTFIDLAEEMIYFNSQKPLRLRAMESTATIATVGGTNSIDLPDDYLELRSITLTAGGKEFNLGYNSPSAIPTYTGSGVPVYYTIIGNEIRFSTTPDGAYDVNINYYAKPTALSATDSTNYILTNHPSIYLYGCLSAIYDFGGEDNDSEMMFAKMMRSIKGAVRGDREGRYPGASMRVRGPTP